MKKFVTILYLCVSGLVLHAMDLDYDKKVADLLSQGLGKMSTNSIPVVRLPGYKQQGITFSDARENNQTIEKVVHNFFKNYNENKDLKDRFFIRYGTYTGHVDTTFGQKDYKEGSPMFYWIYPSIQMPYENFEKFFAELKEYNAGKKPDSLIIGLVETSEQYREVSLDKELNLGIKQGMEISDVVKQALNKVFPESRVVFIPPKWSYFKWLLLPTMLGGAFLAWAISSGYFSNYFNSVADSK